MPAAKITSVSNSTLTLTSYKVSADCGLYTVTAHFDMSLEKVQDEYDATCGAAGADSGTADCGRPLLLSFR